MEQELFQNRREHLNLTSISSPQLFILEIASSDCFCQKSKYNACEVFLLEYFFFFFIHGDWKGKYIYMLVPCAICGGFQSMETYVSTSQVAQFGFSDGCNWSPILWHFCTRELLQVKQAPYVKRLFFFSPPPHPAASRSYRQLVHRALLPSCPETPRVTPAAWCLLQVTVRALAFSGTLAGRGKPSTPKDSVWLF